MKIESILISGFRGFRELVEIPFAPGFTVIDGRNGVGKSTIFDAIEFALTGRLTKYGDMKASGESVDDYLWWRGDGIAPSSRFVEVTLRDGEEELRIRRTPIQEPSTELLARVEEGMVNAGMAPPSPLQQLCATSIIRDENIASLSLELPATQRYAQLRQVIGALDADKWADRGNKLVGIAKKRSEHAKAEVAAANAMIGEANRKVDEARASLASDAAIHDARIALGSLLQISPSAPDQLLSPAREYLAMREGYSRDLTKLLSEWEDFAREASAVAEIETQIEAARTEVARAQADRSRLPEPVDEHVAGPTAELITQLHELRSLGTRIGLIDHSCPLCCTRHDETSFMAGLARAGEMIDRLDSEASELAAEAARRRLAISDSEKRVANAQKSLTSLTTRINQQREGLAARRHMLKACGLAEDAARESVLEFKEVVTGQLEKARHAISVLNTLSQNRQLEASVAEVKEANARLVRAQERAGKARRAEAMANALHDAARRAGSETLDLRLGRVLPLMAELYSRLRPHPVWQDIEYSIRGDLRRFLSLQVGDGLNPQFLFSSGQRRATGLAFLLSINLSLAWSRWRSILLDDPVQHVDDFRTVNLAEVLAQLVAGGRQVIVAVEDSALAELLGRRMPVAKPGEAIRLTLGLDDSGCSTIVARNNLLPMALKVLAA